MMNRDGLQELSRTARTLAFAGAAVLAAAVFAGVAADSQAGTPAQGKPAQSVMEGNAGVAVIGQKAPDFTLADTQGRTHRLSDYTAQGKMVVLEWFNPDCPFVRKHHQMTKNMSELQAKYQGKDVVWLAINSGAPGKQGHGLERNRKAVQEFGIDYPMLLDESGAVGLMYGAKTTPHMYLIDIKGILVYNGAIDNDRSADKLGQTNYLRQALQSVTDGKSVSVPETKPYGCSVKYPG